MPYPRNQFCLSEVKFFFHFFHALSTVQSLCLKSFVLLKDAVDEKLGYVIAEWIWLNGVTRIMQS